MSFDNTKFDIELNGVSHRISGYKKSEANAFVPRLGGGSQSESEFDLLRSKTINGFAGGSLQRSWSSDEACYAIEGMFPFRGNGVLYPNNQLSSITGETLNLSMRIRARHQTKSYVFLIVYNAAVSKNQIYRINKDASPINSITQLTLPTKCEQWEQCCILVHGGKMYLSGADSDGTSNATMFYQNLGGTTFTEIASGSGSVGLMVSYKGSIYGTDLGQGTENQGLFRYTGDTTTKAFTNVGTVTNGDGDVNARLFVWNNRIILTRHDGMWQYDGTTFSAIDDLSAAPDPRNYLWATPYRGYIYFWMPDGFYRYGGSILEKLYDSYELGVPVDIISGGGRLWLLFANTTYNTFSSIYPWYDGLWQYDKSVSSTYDTSTTGSDSANTRLMVYDGVGLYTWGRKTFDTGAGLATNNNQPGWLVWFDNYIYVFRWFTSETNYPVYYSNTKLIGANQPYDIITSVFDGDFSQLVKDIENIEIVVDEAFVSDQQTMTIEYRKTLFDYGTWSTFGTVTLGSGGAKKWAYDSVPAGLSATQRIQLRFRGTSSGTCGIAQIIMRYLLMNEMKYEWQMTVETGNDEPGIEPLLLADGTEDTQTAGTIRENIYACRQSTVPVKYVDVDQMLTTGSHNSSVTTINLDSTVLLKNSGFVKIENEIIKYTGKTATTLTGCTRGALGTTAAAHSTAGTKVYPLYRVMLRQIINEQIEMTDKTIDQSSALHRGSRLTVLLQEV